MKFADPAYLITGLIFTAALSTLLVWAGRNYVKRSSIFAEARTLRLIDANYSERRMALRYGLLAAAIIFMWIALARPQWGFYWAGSSDSGRDVIFAIDLSKSMLCKDAAPDRFTRAKSEISGFVSESSGDRFALIGFAGDAFIYCPLTMNRNSFLRILENLGVGDIRKGGTSYYSLMETAARSMGGAASDHKVLVILSDGEDTEGGVDKAIEEARKSGISVYSIGIGTSAGGTIPDTEEGRTGSVVKDDKGKPVRTRLDEESLKKISESTGGVYIAEGEMAGAIGKVRSAWEAKSDPSGSQELFGKAYKERFQLPLFIAFMCLSLELLLSMANKGNRR